MSPCPTLTALEWGPLTRPPHDRERDGWPIVDVIDRTGEEPWKRSLLTLAVDPPSARPANERWSASQHAPGGHACSPAGSAATLARCERCDAAVVQPDEATLECGRCGLIRPPVCLACGAGTVRQCCDRACRGLRRGDRGCGQPHRCARDRRVRRSQPPTDVPRLRRHRGRAPPRRARRHGRLPRLRPRAAGAALPRRASRRWRCWRGRRRLVGPRTSGRSDPRADVPAGSPCAAGRGASRSGTAGRRRAGAPTDARVASVRRLRRDLGQQGATSSSASLPASEGVIVAGDSERYVARAGDWMTLGEHLSQGVRPPGAKLRVAVDPAVDRSTVARWRSGIADRVRRSLRSRPRPGSSEERAHIEEGQMPELIEVAVGLQLPRGTRRHARRIRGAGRDVRPPADQDSPGRHEGHRSPRSQGGRTAPRSDRTDCSTSATTAVASPRST